MEEPNRGSGIVTLWLCYALALPWIFLHGHHFKRCLGHHIGALSSPSIGPPPAVSVTDPAQLKNLCRNGMYTAGKDLDRAEAQGGYHHHMTPQEIALETLKAIKRQALATEQLTDVIHMQVGSFSRHMLFIIC